VQDEVNQEEIEQNEVDETKKGADSANKAMHIEKEFMIFNEEDLDDQAKVITDEDGDSTIA